MKQNKRLWIILGVALILGLLFLGTATNARHNVVGFLSSFFEEKEKSTMLIPESLISHASIKDKEQFYADHFRGVYGYFLLVGETGVVSYEKPAVTQNVVAELPISSRVQVLYKGEQQKMADGEIDTWVFIANEQADQLLGWVKAGALVGVSKFRAYDRLDPFSFIYERDHFKATVDVNKDGFFNMTWDAKGKGLELNGTSSGKIYSFDDMLWLKKAEPDYILDFFILTEDNTLVQEKQFADQMISTNIKLIGDNND